MYSRARVLNLVKEYFVEREMEVERVEGDQALDLLVRDGRNVIGVKLVVESKLGMSFRDFVEEVLLKSSGLAVDKYYIVVPSVYFPLLPRLEVFKAARVGVLEVRDEEIVERIVAPAREVKASVVSEDVDELRVKLEEVERKLELLSRKVDSIASEVSSLKSIRKELEYLKKSVEEARQRREPRVLQHHAGVVEEDKVEEGDLGDVPSFVVGNPWLKVLSKRKS